MSSMFYYEKSDRMRHILFIKRMIYNEVLQYTWNMSFSILHLAIEENKIFFYHIHITNLDIKGRTEEHSDVIDQCDNNLC